MGETDPQYMQNHELMGKHFFGGGSGEKFITVINFLQDPQFKN